jgi:hypothetical protein
MLRRKIRRLELRIRALEDRPRRFIKEAVLLDGPQMQAALDEAKVAKPDGHQ